MIQTGKGFKTLANGRQWYSYSGIVQGGPTIPAFVDLVDITSTGLRDSYVKFLPYFGLAIAGNPNDPLGILVLIDDVEIIKSQAFEYRGAIQDENFSLFVPRQSKLTVKSINTTNNTLQDRGVVVLGWYS
jgi:hypothetical protein